MLPGWFQAVNNALQQARALKLICCGVTFWQRQELRVVLCVLCQPVLLCLYTIETLYRCSSHGLVGMVAADNDTMQSDYDLCVSLVVLSCSESVHGLVV